MVMAWRRRLIRLVQTVIIITLLPSCSGAAASPPVAAAKQNIKDRSYWYSSAREAIRQRLLAAGQTRPAPSARNVILLVGDGLGMATLTAARILRGQRQGGLGEDAELAWDRFPSVGLAKTYNADAQVGESSACATALLCGVKANFETVGLDARGRFENCASTNGARVPSLLAWAQQEGKATGVVTNARVTHATPAALFSHSPSRYWEDDGKVPPASRRACKDIARQLIEEQPGKSIDVVLGGGRRHFLPKVARDPEEPHEEGRRLDGRNLIEDWLRDRKKRGIEARYAWTKSQLLEAVQSSSVDHVLGLFAYSHMDFEVDRDASAEGDPSLADMTRAALSVLRRNRRGFFLFVEGGRIDHAHHYNNAYRALDETLALENALLAAMELVDISETLIVLTADHSHVLTLGGLATPRGNPILGVDSKASDVDGLPYSTLLYASGPGYTSPRTAPPNRTAASGPVYKTDTTDDDEATRNAVHAAAVPRQWATHGGEDVPVYGQGPLAAALLGGTMDQSYIAHAIAYIACFADFAERCRSGEDNFTIPSLSMTATQVCSHHEGVAGSSSGNGGGSGAAVLASSVKEEDTKKTPAASAAAGAASAPAPAKPSPFLIFAVAVTFLGATCCGSPTSDSGGG